MRLFTGMLFCGLSLWGQTDPAVRAARQYRQAHELEIVTGFMALLTLPSVAANPEGLRRTATEIASRLEERGARVRMLEGAGAPPVVYGEITHPGATRTLLFYAHYD